MSAKHKTYFENKERIENSLWYPWLTKKKQWI